MQNQLPLQRQNTDDFVSNITNQLMDESLQSRFGTSLQVNMGREYQKLLLEKYRQLRYEFKKINKDPSDGITLNELLSFLNNNNESVKFNPLNFLSLNSFQENMEKKFLKCSILITIILLLCKKY